MQKSNELPENVYPISCMPDKLQANNKGNVLWYCKQFGWYTGYFHRPVHSNTTHWTLLPDEPKVYTDPRLEREAAFDKWLSQFPADLDASAISLIKMGFVGGYEYRGNA